MSRKPGRLSRRSIALAVLGVLGAALGFGIAQSSVVTQAEWAVYMTQGLGLDWNLPRNAKSNHYLARLDWTNSITFRAAQMLDGSTATPLEDGSIAGPPDTPGEALYEVATLRPGDYSFRVKMGGGGGVLKVSDHTYELFQPDPTPRWVDLDSVPLNPGEHALSLMLVDGARAEALGVTPPCMLPVEPIGGWTPLAPLNFGQMAVTLAKALDLEKNLPKIGTGLSIRGEDFTRTIVYPYEANMEAGEDDPYWLSSGGSIVTAVARFEVPEKGIYSIETRYLSARPIRWNMDSCLRVVTCPVTAAQIGRRRSLALELDAGEHTLEVTLPPGAKLDRVAVQHRDSSSEEYLRVVGDEGFKLGEADENVRRRDALRAARRLVDRFRKLTEIRCNDDLITMEARAKVLSLEASSSSSSSSAFNARFEPAAPNAPPVTPQVPSGLPLVPPVDPNGPGASSPVEPSR